jgi:hypothetical protein
MQAYGIGLPNIEFAWLSYLLRNQEILLSNTGIETSRLPVVCLSPSRKIIWMLLLLSSRSQWPRGLRHEMSSLAGVVGSNLTRGMGVCIHLFCVCVRQRPCDGLVTRPRGFTEFHRLRNWSETKRFTDVLCFKGATRINQWTNLLSSASIRIPFPNYTIVSRCRTCVVSNATLLIGIMGGGVQWPVVPALGDYDDGEISGMIGRGKQSTQKKPAPVPLYPSQIPHTPRTRIRAAAVGSQRLTSWATARPNATLKEIEWTSRELVSRTQSAALSRSAKAADVSHVFKYGNFNIHI